MAADLARLAREFAAQIAGLLNATVCDGIRISTIPVPPDLVLAGYGLSKQQLQHAPFAVTTGRRRTPRCWLRVGYQLGLDGEGEYLTVASSVFGVYADDQARQPLCRFDYERGKAGYAEAICRSTASPKCCARGRPGAAAATTPAASRTALSSMTARQHGSLNGCTSRRATAGTARSWRTSSSS
jgi:hypothetical protein